ncbi:hypothetical protein L0F63_003550 [Massospora cicadina]|nr:hypothetical protein L0F63_003550 [Massospora cicadina]
MADAQRNLGVTVLTTDFTDWMNADRVIVERGWHKAMSNNASISTFTADTGATVFAAALRQLGVKLIFGIVGIPIVEVAEACIAEGVRFIGCRNEQTASYAAGAYGYLTGTPGVCLVVSGPGVVHALSGLYNAQANCWPMVLVGGSCESSQELDQVAACRAYTKYAGRPLSISVIPSLLERAFSCATSGRPGPAYLDFPADLIRGRATNVTLNLVPHPNPRFQAATDAVQKAADLLTGAKRPLLIIGKGVGLARAERQMAELVELTGAPFLPSPMAKGTALQNADVVLVLGARLNWMFQFGRRFNEQVKLIVADIEPEEIGQNRPADVALVGDLALTLGQLIQAIRPRKPRMASYAPFRPSHEPPPGHRAKSRTALTLPSRARGDYVLVSEGARTMDVTRVLVSSQLPRHRLDAGTLGAMGVGMGAIAAQLAYPNRRVVGVFGDSAFGFSAMDVETAIRYKFPLVLIIINNGGIYHGLKELAPLEPTNSPSFALSPNTRYELLAKVAPGSTNGWGVRSPEELEAALKKALERGSGLSIINVHIDHRPASEGLYWMDNSATSSKL